MIPPERHLEELVKKLKELIARASAADQTLVSALTARFDARLASLKQADARMRLLQAFASDKPADSIMAGSSF